MTGSVLFDGTTYKMWYAGGNASWTGQIGYATSPDGITWTKNPNPVITDIGNDIIADIPNKFVLSQNYPNPFNPSTKIKFTLPKADKVKIELYNNLGQNVKDLLNKHMKAGQHEVEFNAQNLSSGVYFYKIEAGEFQDVKKMILLR
jgi:hypothetical protein